MNVLSTGNKGWLCAAGLLISGLLAGCGGGDQGRDPVLGLPAASLLSVAVTPALTTIASGATQQFTATATYSDGASRDVSAASAWTSATPAIATVNTAGLASGVASGAASIGASFGGKSGSAALTVTPATLVSMTLTPATPILAAGATQQFVARGTYTDGTAHDITATASFVSATPAVATIAAGGLATGIVSGSSLITASSGTQSASTVLTVKPATLVSLALAPLNPTLPIGATRQFALTASYSDGSTANVSATSAWTSATPAVASIGSANGLALGVAAGTSVVGASFMGMTANTSVTVPSAVLASIAVSPNAPSILVGSKQAFVATASYSDGAMADVSASANWTSGTVSVATVLPGGVASGLVAGSATITASLGTVSGSATLTVMPVVVAATLNLGSAANFGVLAGTSITNNSGGLTLVTGDVGSPSQTVDPVQVAGFANYKSGAVLATGLADLQTAITDARGRTCDVSSPSGIDLGGLTLAPGVYCYTGAINITGTLTLNGPGVYIFLTSSTLNTTANSIVALTGGASSEQVFWVPTGPTTLGATSVFKGSLLGQVAAITLGDGASLQTGRVLTASAVTLKNNVISR